MLTLENICVQVNSDRFLLRDVEFKVAKGEILGIMGSSGAGKTTLLRAIAGLVPLFAGRVLVDKQEITNWPVSRRPVSYMQQSYPLYENMSVLDNVFVAFLKPLRQVTSSEKKLVCEMLESFGLPESMWARSPSTLSGGELQRTALVKALLKPSEVLLLDEPFSNVDKSMRRLMSEVLVDVVSKRHLATIYVSHDEHDLLLTADQVGLLKSGNIIQLGSGYEFWKAPRTIDAASVGSIIGAQKLRLADLGDISVMFDWVPDGAKYMVWRPEAAQLVTKEESPEIGSRVVRIPMEISRITENGAETYYSLRYKSGRGSTIFHNCKASETTQFTVKEELVLAISQNKLFFTDDGGLVL